MKLDLKYISRHPSGWQVRLPASFSPRTRFFNDGDEGKNASLAKAKTFRDSMVKGKAWLNPSQKTKRSGQDALPVGVYHHNNRGVPELAATWVYEGKPMKKVFSVRRYGFDNALLRASMARDFGVLAEEERLQEEYAERNRVQRN